MDRFKVMEVQCSECQTIQQVSEAYSPSLADVAGPPIGVCSCLKAQQTCEQCHVQFGEYYCDICHLFDKDKKQYHCQPCGICR